MWERAKEVWLQFSRVRVGMHASSIAFYFFLSVVPLIIVYACLVPVRALSAQDMVSLLSGIVPEALSTFVSSLVVQAYTRTGLVLSLSVVTLLWTISQGAKALRRGLNAVYEVKETRNAATAAGVSLLFVVAMLTTLTLVLYLVFSGGVLSAIAGLIPVEEVQITVAGLLESLAMLVVGILIFAACYTYLAAGSRKFRAQIPGALFTAAAWYGLSVVLRAFLAHFNRFTLYGSLAAPALFLFWLFCILYILLVGGFINHCCADWIERKFGIRS